MDFALNDEQRGIQELAREVAEAEIVPHAAAWDREHRFPVELYARLGELGLMGVCVPEELGGAGADFLSYVLVLEELSRADAGVGVTVAVHTSAATLPIVAFGSAEQRERLVPPLARGELLGAFALTEPESGSDAGSLRTTATRDGGGWVIDGTNPVWEPPASLRRGPLNPGSRVSMISFLTSWERCQKVRAAATVAKNGSLAVSTRHSMSRKRLRLSLSSASAP